MSRLDDLNRDVTSTILFAEQLEAVGSEYASEAFALVSLAEQRLATELEYGSGESNLAWRGAVRAALKSGNMKRANGLITYLKCQVSRDSALIAELVEMLK